MASDQDKVMERAPADLQDAYSRAKKFLGMMRNPLGNGDFPPISGQDVQTEARNVHRFLMLADQHLSNGKLDANIKQEVWGLTHQFRDAMLFYLTFAVARTKAGSMTNGT